MFLDASAMIAIVAREDDGASLAARLGHATEVYTSPVAFFEAAVGLARIGNIAVADAQTVLERFLDEVDAQVIAVSDEIGREALNAFARFGRGRHAAQLNMGDCFAYACARVHQVPLLFKGNDFPQTDIDVA